MVQSGKVPFDTTIIGQCLCTECPVQAKSSCAERLKRGLEEALKNSPLKREDIPGMYCGTGKATCTDLDYSQSCLCFGCNVFSQYGLGKGNPMGYYCRDGISR